MRLYHYTCAHAADQIRRDMVLKPHTQIQLDGRSLIWFTDLDKPDVGALGLTSVHLQCDRTEWRAVVSADLDSWPGYLRHQDKAFRAAARGLIGPDALPMHWYISRWPVAVHELEATR